MPTFDVERITKIAILVGLIISTLGIVLAIPYIAESLAAIPGLGDIYIRFANAVSGYLLKAKILFNAFLLPGFEWVLSAVLMTFGLNWFTRFTASITLKLYSAFSKE